jgi:Flp pilus assembly protein TadD
MLTDSIEQVRALHFGEAINILRRVLSLDPACAIALRILGVVYALAGRNVEAYQPLDQEIEANPFDALALSYRCLLKAADGKDSETDCKEAVLLHDLPQSHIGLALSLASAGKGPEAYEEATRAIALDPTSAVGYGLRGEIAAALNQGDNAKQDQEKAASLAIEQAK